MRSNATSGFFRSRWQGTVPMPRLFWRDLLLIGSVINVAASLVGLVLIAGGAPGGWALALHLAPVPYNLFLLLAVARSAERNTAIELAAGLWFVMMLLV